MPLFIVSLVLAVYTIIAVPTALSAQTNLVRKHLQSVAQGKLEEVKKDLPDLLAEFPNDPGVMFLHAVVIQDAVKANSIYELIIREHSTSEWADDAQWRIVQYHAIRRDTLRARKELNIYRNKYPLSEYLLSASDMVKATVGLPKFSDKQPVEQSAPSKSEVMKNDAPKTGNTAKSDTPKATDAKDINKAAQKTESKATGEMQTKVPPATQQAKQEEKPPAEKSTLANNDKSAGKQIFSLQVGSYPTKEIAEEQVKLFKQRRLRASVLEKTVGSEIKYAVIIGEYTSRESADKARPIVQKQCECAPFVVQR